MNHVTTNFERIRLQALAKLSERPADRPRIAVNVGTCSMAAGAEEVLSALREILAHHNVQADVIEAGCLGACWAEPLIVLTVPGRPSVIYGPLTPEMVGPLVTDSLLGDEPHAAWAVAVIADEGWQDIPSWREHPFFAGQQRIVLENCGLIDPASIEEYIAHDGYQALAQALTMKPEEVIGRVKDSGLRGRGGAGFPTGVKWELTANAPGETRYVICNADESEPGTFKDRLIMEGDPHRVVESIAINAYAIGAQEAFVYIRGEYPLAAQRLETAIRQATSLGLLGSDVLGSHYSLLIHVHRSAGAYICGEETALIESLEGKRPEPRVRPPYPPTHGLWGQPTVVNNVETLAAVPPILRHGAEWFQGIGTEKSKGTKVYMLLGDVTRSGAVEVPLGLTLRQAVDQYGSGLRGGNGWKMAQVGGSAGNIVPTSLADEPMDFEAFRRSGLTLGAGVVLVGQDDRPVLDLLRVVNEFFMSESCGKCTPCREGTVRANEILARLARGVGFPDDLTALEELARVLQLASFCGLGQFAALPLSSALRAFRAELEEGLGRGEHVAAAPRQPELSPAGDGTTNLSYLADLGPAHAEGLVDMLREMNDRYHYIPMSALREVAQDMGVPESQAFSTATFYSQFSLAPRGRHIIRYCRNAPCHLRGASEVLAALVDTLGVSPGETTADGLFTLEPVNCLGICGVAPVILIDEKPYGNLTPELVKTVVSLLGRD